MIQNIRNNSESTLFLIFSISLFILLSGCIKKADPPDYVKIVGHYTTPEGTFANPSTCLSMLCENQTGYFLFFKTGIKPGLYTGKCYFKEFDPLNDSSMQDLNKIIALNKTERIKYFMIGQGPNLASADEAQRFCDGNLGVAIHWLIGNSTVDPPVPDKVASEKSLKNGMIPFYIYYTNSTNLPSSVIGGTGLIPMTMISMAVNGQGPVILAPEAEFEPSKHPDKLIAYPAQFASIKQNCDKCLVSAFVKYNDIETIDFLNTTSFGIYNPVLRDAVDFVTFSMDLNKFNCDKYRIADQALNFSSVILHQYGKPSFVILKSTVSGKCTEDNIAGVYEYMYSNIPLFVPNGMIGMANNDLAAMFDSGGRQDQPMFNAWFQNCRFYYNQSTLLESPQVPLLFPKSGETANSPCTFLNTMSMMLSFKCNQNYSEVIGVEPFDSNESFGDTCLADSILNEIGNTGKQLDEDAGKALDGYEKYCEQWEQQIRQFSAQYNYDPSIARSLIWYNTDFDPTKSAFTDSQVQQCTHCQEYSGGKKTVCCGIETLAYYRDYTIANLNPAVYYMHTLDYMKYYYSIYGYYYGQAALQTNIDEYEQASSDYYNQNSESFIFSFDSSVNSVISGASKLRKTCGICGVRGAQGDAPAQWLQPAGAALTSPLPMAQCTERIGVNKGVYWTTGIMLNQTVENTNVTAALAGTIKEIGYSARKFKYIITEGQGTTIIYSNLVSTDKRLVVGRNVAVRDNIGKAGGQLRFEVCQGSYSQCADASLGLNREFRDSSSSLGLTCLN